MPNSAIVVYDKTLTAEQFGPSFGRRKIVPHVYEIDPVGGRFSVGDEIMSLSEAPAHFLSGYFVTRVPLKDLSRYLQQKYQSPEIPAEILATVPLPARAAYNVKTMHQPIGQSGSIMLIWKPIERDSDVHVQVVFRVIQAWNRFAGSLVADGLMIESNKLNVASSRAFVGQKPGELARQSPNSVRQLITFDSSDDDARIHIATELSVYAPVELRPVNILCGASVDPIEHLDG